MRKQFNSALQNEAIDRSNKNKLKINKNKIVSQVKINVPTYNKKKLPEFLKKIPTISPGSRNLK